MESRSIFVSGVASGIGAATARHFSNKGWRVGLVDRQDGPLRTLAAEIGPRTEVFDVDVADSTQVAAALAKFCATSAGRLGALFNSAGILDMRRFDDTPLDRLYAIVDVNLRGVVNCIHAALPI